VALVALGLILNACSSRSSDVGRPMTAPSTAAKSSPTQAPARAAHALAGESAWIAYQTDRGGEGTWLIHPDGTNNHEVGADFAGDLILPNWSPDGKSIVMTSRNTGGSEPLYEFDLQSERIHQLVPCKDPCLGDDEPVFSPDGKTVAFIRALGPFKNDAPADCGLWLGDVASHEVWQITSNRGCDREYFPRWSPDGSQLTYWRWKENLGSTTGTAVFVIDIDGSHERQLTAWKTFAGDPDWSPDGKWILFSTYPLAAFEVAPKASNLYRMRSDGSDVQQLTDYGSIHVRATQPRFTPDGKRILFTADTGSSRELWLMPAKGGKPVPVATGGIYTHGTWQPE
jgi:Tol biopolymer transport system component